MKTQILKPGILVGLKTSVSGGVRYKRVDLSPEAIGLSSFDADGQDVAAWETIRTIEDPAEYAASRKARSSASGLIRKSCALTSFGLLCPEDREDELDAAIEQARALVDEYNATAKATRVSLYVLRGRIAQSDEEAAAAIAAEVRDLLDTMGASIKAGDVKAIREAADAARRINATLDPKLAENVATAIDEARKAAREIVKRVGKDGEDRAAVIESIKLDAISSARAAFLDLSDDAPAPAEAMPAIDVRRAASLDLSKEAV